MEIYAEHTIKNVGGFENVGTLAVQVSDATASPRKSCCIAPFILNIVTWGCTLIWVRVGSSIGCVEYGDGHLASLKGGGSLYTTWAEHQLTFEEELLVFLIGWTHTRPSRSAVIGGDEMKSRLTNKHFWSQLLVSCFNVKAQTCDLIKYHTMW